MIVFTECFNCAPICRVMLDSYFKYHEHPIIVCGTTKDFEILEFVPDRNIHLMQFAGDDILNGYKIGHKGTAALFSRICNKNDGKIVHIDSDIYFKKESLSEIKNAFNEGYDIVGTRRCYGNNPGGVKGLENYPDTISTYFMGMDLKKLAGFNEDQLARMWQGAWHPLGWPILDFGDSVTHTMLSNGAKIKYLDWNKFGSQNVKGEKTNAYKSNLHLDMGSHLAHFGGIGTGYSVYNKISTPESGYAEWSLGRYELFQKLFYNEQIDYHSPTQYGSDGRWVNGSPDEIILNLIKTDLQN